MNLQFPLRAALFVLCPTAPLLADLTYVDADFSTNTSGQATPIPTNEAANDLWRQRAFGTNGTIFEADGNAGPEDAPQLTTVISGLDAGESYDVWVNFYDVDNDANQNWSIRAGFSPGSLKTFTDPDGDAGDNPVAGSEDSVLASSFSYVSAPLFDDGGGRMLNAGYLGEAIADGSGEITVIIDDTATTVTSNNRTWYDGVSHELATPPADDGITYVDATSGAGNTTLADGSPFNPPGSGTTGVDNDWEIRNLGTFGDTFEAGGEEPAEDAPELRTTLTGLDPGTDYEVYAFFWDANGTVENWSLRVGKESDPGNNALFAAADASGILGGANTAPPASSLDYNGTPPLFTEANRVLLAAPRGVFTANASGEIEVFLDDRPAQTTVNLRTWYDGLGYREAQPLDPAGDADGDGLNNGAEAIEGTDAYIIDTDGDGFGDGIEVSAGSDPLDPGSVPPLPGNSLEMTADGVWTWFNDERAIFHQGSLFTGYVRSNGEYGVTRYDPETDTSHDMTISTPDSREQDDHNNPSITVLPDGNLLVIYSKHITEPRFYQRTSLVNLPSDDADWGPEIATNLPANNTYSNTYLLEKEVADGNDHGRIYNFHRCINFNPTITVSDDLGASWEPSVQFIEVGSGGVRPYPRYCTNDFDRIDLIYTDGHPRDVNNSVYHMFYQSDEDGTPGGGSFHKTDASLVGSYASLPLDHEGGERGSVVYQYSSAPWGPGDGPDDWIPNARGWTWDVHYGADGNPVCVFQVQLGSDGGGWANSRIYYYYARWTGTEWQKRFIAKAGRGIYPAESDYGGGMTIDPENPNVIYISSNAAEPFDLQDPGFVREDIYDVPLKPDARFEIYRGVTDDGGLTFEWEALTENSAADNLRPIIPEESPYDRTLVWFNGSYSSYVNYDCKVLALLENDLNFKGGRVELDPGAESVTLTWKSSPGRSYRIVAAADLASGFTIEAAQGVDSQGGTTTHTFPLPASLEGLPAGFFRVEEE